MNITIISLSPLLPDHINSWGTCLSLMGPGATVWVIVGKLPRLLGSLPSSFRRIIVHMGINNSPISSLLLEHGILDDFSASTSVSGQHALGRTHFIDNFNLFWKYFSFLRTDGIHPKRLGIWMLVANLQHAVQSSAHACLPPTLSYPLPKLPLFTWSHLTSSY